MDDNQLFATIKTMIDIMILQLSSMAAVSSHLLPPPGGGIPHNNDDNRMHPLSLKEVGEYGVVQLWWTTFVDTGGEGPRRPAALLPTSMLLSTCHPSHRDMVVSPWHQQSHGGWS